MTREEFLDEQEITVSCDACVRRVSKSYRWLRANFQYLCTCGVEIDLRSEPYRKIISRIEAEAAKYPKAEAGGSPS
jgi:hypothetical protein